jgi:hypothetical protein
VLLTQRRHRCIAASYHHSITSSARLLELKRHVEAEHLGGNQVDDEIEFGRLLDGGPPPRRSFMPS